MKKIFIILILFYSFLFSSSETVFSSKFYSYHAGFCPSAVNFFNDTTVNSNTPASGYYSSLITDAVTDEVVYTSSHVGYHTFYSDSLGVRCSYYDNLHKVGAWQHYSQHYHHYDKNVVSPVIPLPPTCSQNQHVDTSTNLCVSDPGYHLDGNTSVPDVFCPPPMKYKYVAMPSYKFDIKTCVPDSNISESVCLQNPNNTFLKPTENLDDERFKAYLVYGSGCVDKSYLASQASQENFSFLVSGLLPSVSGKFLFKFGNTLGNLFARSKNLFHNVLNAFKSSPDATLFTHQPEVIDMTMGSDGVFSDVSLTPNTPTPPPDNSWSDVYQQYINNGWDFPQAPNDVSPDVADFQINRPSFPTVPKPDLYYQGDDVTSFNDSDIGSANLASGGLVPDLSTHLNSPLNTQFQTSVNVAPDVLSTSAPVQLQTDLFHYSHSTDISNNIVDVFKGKIHYADGTSSDIVINRTQYPDGSGVNDIHLSHNIITSSTPKNFATNYQTSFDTSGNTLTTLNDPTSVSSVDSSGNTVISSNLGSSSLDTSITSNPVNLEPLSSRLDNINNTIKDLVNYTPKVSTEANANLNSFDQAFNAFDVNFGDYKNFLSGIVTNINDISTQFNDTKNLLENKPTIQQINGTCGFDVTMYGKSHHVDICAFVSPYRPVLSSFFTLFMSFAVIAFAFKFLFKD